MHPRVGDKLKRITSYPEGHWRLPIAIPFSMGVRCGELICLSGQVDFHPHGSCRHPGDLETQTAAAVKHVECVLNDLGCEMSDLTKLTVFYVQDGTVDEDAYCTRLADLIAGNASPTLALIPMPHLAYPGLMVEIDAYAMRAENGARLARSYVDVPNIPKLCEPFVLGLRCGELIFLSAQNCRDVSGIVTWPDDIVVQSERVLGRIAECLQSLGAEPADIVKVNTWYTGAGTVEDWIQGARIRAEFFPEPGPAATGIPLPRLGFTGEAIRMDAWAMRARDGTPLPRTHAWPEAHWSWPIHLPFMHGVHSGDLIFEGGQVSLNPQGHVLHPGDMTVQSKTSMENVGRVLVELGATYADIVKINTFYVGGARGDDLHANVGVRSRYFDRPGPASTGVPLEYLAYPEMVIEIEAIVARRRLA